MIFSSELVGRILIMSGLAGLILYFVVFNNIPQKRKPAKKTTQKQAASPTKKKDILMLSQLAALYVYKRKKEYRKRYMEELENVGVPANEAKAMFEFDCVAIRKYAKKFLMHPAYTWQWIFGLSNPFFCGYPSTK